MSIAGAGDPAHQLARFAAHLVRLLAERPCEQSQQRTPSFERFAHLVHGLGRGKFRVGQCAAAVGNNRQRGGCKAVAEDAAAPSVAPFIAFF